MSFSLLLLGEAAVIAEGLLLWGFVEMVWHVQQKRKIKRAAKLDNDKPPML